MMVLGSFEFPFNQMTIEEAWNTFCFDIGQSIWSLPARSITFVDPPETVVLLPAPFTYVRRIDLASSVYESQLNGTPIAHGLGPESLRCLPPGSVRVVPPPVDMPGPPVSPPFVGYTVTKVLSATRVQVEPPPTLGTVQGLLIVASANTRTFQSPAALAACLNTFCQSPFTGQEFLRRLRWEYHCASLELVLASETGPGAACGKPRDQGAVRVNTQNDENLLFSLLFNIPHADAFPLTEPLVSCGFPSQWPCRRPVPLRSRGLPAQPVCTEYELDPDAMPPTFICTERGGPRCIEQGL